MNGLGPIHVTHGDITSNETVEVRSELGRSVGGFAILDMEHGLADGEIEGVEREGEVAGEEEESAKSDC